jgi:hypothetical protein
VGGLARPEGGLEASGGQSFEQPRLTVPSRASVAVGIKCLAPAWGVWSPREFTDPQRLARLGVDRFRSFAACRGLGVSRLKATPLVDAARQALPAGDAQVGGEAIAADLQPAGHTRNPDQAGRPATGTSAAVDCVCRADFHAWMGRDPEQQATAQPSVMLAAGRRLVRSTALRG